MSYSFINNSWLSEYEESMQVGKLPFYMLSRDLICIVVRDFLSEFRKTEHYARMVALNDLNQEIDISLEDTEYQLKYGINKISLITNDITNPELTTYKFKLYTDIKFFSIFNLLQNHTFFNFVDFSEIVINRFEYKPFMFETLYITNVNYDISFDDGILNYKYLSHVKFDISYDLYERLLEMGMNNVRNAQVAITVEDLYKKDFSSLYTNSNNFMSKFGILSIQSIESVTMSMSNDEFLDKLKDVFEESNVDYRIRRYMVSLKLFGSVLYHHVPQYIKIGKYFNKVYFSGKKVSKFWVFMYNVFGVRDEKDKK